VPAVADFRNNPTTEKLHYRCDRCEKDHAEEMAVLGQCSTLDWKSIIVFAPIALKVIERWSKTQANNMPFRFDLVFNDDPPFEIVERLELEITPSDFDPPFKLIAKLESRGNAEHPQANIPLRAHERMNFVTMAD
jgi:hypothetical protein